MDILEKLNAAMAYIEANLRDEIDVREAARLALSTPDSFLRFFSYMTGMSLAEYVRRRRLSLAAEDLRRGAQVVDAAVMYGYDSAAAFSRAFVRQHGITPGEYKRVGGPLSIYPPASFRINVLGARKMDLSIIRLDELNV